MTVRVLIVDDQEAVREALRLVLDAEPDMEVVSEAGDGGEAVHAAQVHRPDIVVIDIRMPRMDGIAAIRRLTDPTAPHRPTVVAMTTFDLDDYLFGALQAGAVGFVLKDTHPQLLVDAIRAAAGGHGIIDPKVTPRLVQRFAALSPTAAGPDLDQLTAREREVLLHIAAGSSNAEIAAALWIEEGTVKTHVARILAKLGLRTRVHAAIYAYEHGLVER
jgi:DNA-binding NarL/FixJ family response regulator